VARAGRKAAQEGETKMVTISPLSGKVYYLVVADTAAELDPIRGLLERVAEPGDREGGRRYKVWRPHVAEVQKAITTLPAAPVKAQTPGASVGICVECGDPTDAPHFRYCSECYQPRRTYRGVSMYSRYEGDY
jgi:hypothetical protein